MVTKQEEGIQLRLFILDVLALSGVERLHVLSYRSAKNRSTLSEKKQFNQDPSIFCDNMKLPIGF